MVGIFLKYRFKRVKSCIDHSFSLTGFAILIFIYRVLFYGKTIIIIVIIIIITIIIIIIIIAALKLIWSCYRNTYTRSHPGWPHHRGLHPLLSRNSSASFFTSHRNQSEQWRSVWRGSTVFLPCPRGLNYLQMLEQRQHILVSYLDTLCVVPVRAFEPATSCSADESLFTWAN